MTIMSYLKDSQGTRYILACAYYFSCHIIERSVNSVFPTLKIPVVQFAIQMQMQWRQIPAIYYHFYHLWSESSLWLIHIAKSSRKSVLVRDIIHSIPIVKIC